MADKFPWVIGDEATTRDGDVGRIAGLSNGEVGIKFPQFKYVVWHDKKTGVQLGLDDNPAWTIVKVSKVCGNQPTPFSGHVHAFHMAEYAKDAIQSSNPWKDWQSRTNGGEWKGLIQNPEWMTHIQYRRKPKFFMIGDWEVPTPVTVAKSRVRYYYPSLTGQEPVDYLTWDGMDWQLRMLQRGMVHESRENALVHATALISFSKVNP